MELKLGKRASGQKIIDTFKNAGPKDQVNWKHKKGAIFMAGGILSRIDKHGSQEFAINGKWVRSQFNEKEVNDGEDN